MEIETFTEGQWQRYRAIRLRALADAPDAFARTLGEEEAFPKENWCKRLSSGAKTFVAVLDGRDVGLAAGAAWKGRAGAAGLFQMWVAPEARRRNIGIALVSRVKDWALASGFDQLILDVADNNAAAISLYSRAGFQPTGNVGALPPPREHLTEHERSMQLHPRNS